MKKFTDVNPYEFIGNVWIPVVNPIDRIDESIEKIFECVKSCKTHTQLQSVYRMIFNFESVHHSKELTKRLYEYADLKYEDLLQKTFHGF